MQSSVSITQRALTIRRVEVIPIRVRLSFKRTLSKGPVSEGAADPIVGAPVLVRIETDGGAVGYAQVRPPTPWLGETTESIIAAIRRYYGPAIIGLSVHDRQEALRRFDAMLPRNSVAQAALEIALHDVAGRALGVPVYALLGGSRQEIPLDWSVSLNPDEKMVEESVRAVRQHGVRIICLKVGPRERWAADVAIFKAVRGAVGPDVEIGIDPNEGYDAATTIRVLRQLESDHVAYVEQPLPRADVAGLRALRGASDAPLLIDESAITLAETLHVIQASACDGIVLKLWKTSGLTGARAMGALAHSAGLSTTIGGVAHGSVLEAAACAHLYSSLPARAMAAEFVLGLNVVDLDPVVGLPADFTPRNGSVITPDGPGLGVEVDMEKVGEIALGRYSVE